MSRSCSSVNGPQNGCSVGKSRADWLMATATIASTSSARSACQRRCSAGSSDSRAAVRAIAAAIAAEEQEDDRRLAGAEGGRQRLALDLARVRAGRPRPGLDRAGPRASGDPRRARARSSAPWASTQSATASRAARQAASAVSALIRAASASSARRSSDGAIAAAASRSLAAIAAGVADDVVDAVDLAEPVAGGRLDSPANRPGCGRRGSRPGRLPSAPDVRGSVSDAAASALAMWASYARWADRNVSSATPDTGPGVDGHLAAFVGDWRASPHGPAGSGRHGSLRPIRWSPLCHEIVLRFHQRDRGRATAAIRAALARRVRVRHGRNTGS